MPDPVYHDAYAVEIAPDPYPVFRRLREERRVTAVVAADISGKEKDTAAAVGSFVIPFHCDVTREVDVEALMAQAVKEFGHVDTLLNVARIGKGGLVEAVTTADCDQTLDVDLRGVLFGMKRGIRAMLKTGGGVIPDWSSIGGLDASPGTSVYSAAKAAAVEYGPKGVRANALCPGPILTGVVGAAGAKHFPEMLEGQPIKVAEVAAFLASDRPCFVSGAIIPIDGGWSARLA